MTGTSLYWLCRWNVLLGWYVFSLLCVTNAITCTQRMKLVVFGVMAAFYTQKDGSKNEYTNETYHELYDPESFEKNKWVRDVAQ